jgi:hypothetical protein
MAIYLSLAAVDPIKIPNVLPVENTKWERISTGDYILIRCDFNRTTLVDQISINILILYINYTLIINVLPVENMKWERITACDIIVLTQEISSTGPH